MNAQQWFAKGYYQEVLGHKIFVIDSAKDLNINMSKPTLCILHGFPTSSYDYWKVIDILAAKFRVVIHDHLGFGFSDKPMDYSYSLIDQTDIAVNLWQIMKIESTRLLAHDYGTSILTEILARDNQLQCPIVIEQIILCNGSMHIEMAKLRLMQLLLRNGIIGPLVARLSNVKTLHRNLKNIYVNPSLLDEAEIDAIWHMMTFNEGKKVLSDVSRYTYERKRLWHRWIGALKSTELPIEIIWPDSDPIAVPAMANLILEETKNSHLHWLDNLGHFPMLEDPNYWSARVLSSLDKIY